MSLRLVTGLWTGWSSALKCTWWECGPFQPWIELATGLWGRVRSRRALKQGSCPFEAGHWAEDWSRGFVPALCPPAGLSKEALGQSWSQVHSGACAWVRRIAVASSSGGREQGPFRWGWWDVWEEMFDEHCSCQAGLVVKWAAQLPRRWQRELLTRTWSIELCSLSKGRDGD